MKPVPQPRWRRWPIACIGALARASFRCLISSPTIGLLLALYGLATHYVAAMRAYAPWPVLHLFDVKSHLGNVFYAAGRNLLEFGPNLVRGQWSAAIENLTNVSGIRADIYQRVLHADATNNAEAFVLWAPAGIGLLLALRVGVALRRRRTAPPGPPTSRIADGLAGAARIGIASAFFTSLFLNTVEFYQGLSGIAGLMGYVGSALTTVLDTLAAAGAAFFKEVIWHVVYLVTDGKEKTIGLLTNSRPVEDLSHYLAHFPERKIPDALHTATYQALIAAIAACIAYRQQLRITTAMWAAQQPAPRRTAPKKRKPRPRRH